MLHKQNHFTRELLYTRHVLSHPQIDTWIGKSEQSANLDEKLQEMARMAEFIAITDAFVKAGLNFISFKGPLLSYRLYGDTTYRRYHDFDFLFDIQSTEIANKILVERGYSPVFNQIPDKDCKKKIFFKNTKEIYLYNSEKDTSIEIHWKLFSDRFLSSNKLQQIISSNLSEISFAGRKFTVLNPELDLLYLVIHGGLHCFRRLKWLIDIMDFLEKVPIDEEKFQQLTLRLNASRLVALCNEVLKVYFPDSNGLPGNYKVHSYLLRFTLEKIESATYEDKKSFKEFVRGYRFKLRAFPGWRYKVSVLHYIFFGSYVAHENKIVCIPFAYVFIVPFEKVFRWLKARSEAKSKPKNDDL